MVRRVALLFGSPSADWLLECEMNNAQATRTSLLNRLYLNANLLTSNEQNSSNMQLKRVYHLDEPEVSFLSHIEQHNEG